MGVYDSLHYKEDSYQQIINAVKKVRQLIAIINIVYSLHCINKFCLCILKMCIGYTDSMLGSTLQIGKNCWYNMPNG
jgi:hypothetical protein